MIVEAWLLAKLRTKLRSRMTEGGRTAPGPMKEMMEGADEMRKRLNLLQDHLEYVWDKIWVLEPDQSGPMLGNMTLKQIFSKWRTPLPSGDTARPPKRAKKRQRRKRRRTEL